MFKSLFNTSILSLGLSLSLAALAQAQTDVTYLLPAPPNSPAFAPWVIAKEKAITATRT